MDIRPLCGGGCRPPLREAGTRARSHVARPEASRGHSVSWRGNGVVPTPEALPGPGSPGLGGCPRRPPSFRTYVADASLRAMSGGTWSATDSATLGPLIVSGRNLRRTLPGGGRNTEEGMSSHPPGRLGGGAQSGAGSGAEGAGLGTGLGGPVTAGRGAGFGGDRPPNPRGACSRLWDSCGASVRTPRCARAEAGGWRAWESAR